MDLHADLTRRAAVDTAAIAWTASGAGIVERRLEHADGGLRRTAIVHLAPGAALPAAPPGSVIDALVLGGELRDRARAYPAGVYVHAPAGAHVLVAAAPCTVFVKHRPSVDRTLVAIDTRRVAYQPGDFAGLERAPLCVEPTGIVITLLRFAPGARIPLHVHPDGEEFFVLAGAVEDELGTYPAGWWVRQPPGSSHHVDSAEGCVFFTVAHHLPPRAR